MVPAPSLEGHHRLYQSMYCNCHFSSLFTATNFRDFLEKPYACSLAINKSCDIQSKALVISVSNIPVVGPLSNASLSFSNIKSKQC